MKGEYGHRKMIVWKNLDMIEQIIYRSVLPKLPKNCFSMIDQIDRSCSSSMANFIEGYYSSSRKEYVRFLKYSKRSLAELQDWVRRSFIRNFIDKETYETADDLFMKTLYLENRLIYSLTSPPS